MTLKNLIGIFSAVASKRDQGFTVRVVGDFNLSETNLLLRIV